MTSGIRLEVFLDSELPAWVRHREAAIGWRPDIRVMEGWIDHLLEGPEGYVLVDPKTYPGSDPERHIRAKYLGQMAAYRNAVLAATGKPVLQPLIHFPALGSAYEVSEAWNPGAVTTSNDRTRHSGRPISKHRVLSYGVAGSSALH